MGSRAGAVLTLSRLSYQEEKGQHRVLAAMPKVLEHYPEARYVVAGLGTDERIDKVLSEHPELARILLRIGPVSESRKLSL